ncbi:MAG: DUF2817 domain-containing protein [Clostridia bacterium]|nr:DUF2817 domain-containing protein [Clostridia bacterium]
MTTFYTHYKDAKEAFLKLANQVPEHYEKQLTSHLITEDLSMDILDLKPKFYDKLLCLTTGLHGIEGYMGNYAIQLFFEALLDKCQNTRIICIHSINPHGMKYYRKVNEENIDLNRNFILDNLRPENPSFEKAKDFFLPKPMKSISMMENIKFYKDVFQLLLKYDLSTFKEGALKGQYDYPEGFFYGGTSDAKSTTILKMFFKNLLDDPCEKRVFIDFHTGFGPKNQMSIVNSAFEKRTVETLKKQFHYPLIQKSDGEDFYAISGDMIDYLYHYLEPSDYAACFEFGTIGESLLSQMKSLRIMIQESCQHHNPNPKLESHLLKEFQSLYMPNHEKWLKKARMDFLMGLSGILEYYDMM